MSSKVSGRLASLDMVFGVGSALTTAKAKNVSKILRTIDQPPSNRASSRWTELCATTVPMVAESFTFTLAAM
jgi:hypothetical protein